MPTVTLSVNGAARSVEAWDAEMPLLYALRNDLGLHAAKFGCGLGQCGSCTVLVDDAPARSCVVRLKDVAGKRVVTAEGPGLAREAASGAGRVHRRAGGAMRLLHQRHGDEHGRAAPAHAAAFARGGAGRARRQPLPLRLARSGAARGAAGRRRGEELSMGSRSEAVHAAPSLTRRTLLEAGALVVGFSFAPLGPARAQSPAQPGAWRRTGRCRSTRSIRSSRSAPMAGVVVRSGKVDLGTGHRIAMRQMVGEELGVGVDRIELIEGDSALTPNQGPTAGSTGVMRGGVELRQAAATAREALLALAAERLKRPAAELALVDGAVRAPDGRRVAFAELVGRAASTSR
jgi:hypothetical protein